MDPYTEALLRVEQILEPLRHRHQTVDFRAMAVQIVKAVVKEYGYPQETTEWRMLQQKREAVLEEQLRAQGREQMHAGIADYCTNLARAVVRVPANDKEDWYNVSARAAFDAFRVMLEIDAQRHTHLAGIQIKGSAFNRVGEGR